jgi:hypothetical protein
VRQRLKLILFAALSAALTVAGLSLAAGGGSSGSKRSDTTRTWDVKRDFGGPGLETRLDEDLADVMRQIHEAVGEQAPEIAEPTIAKAEDAGDITADQADKLRALVKAEADRSRPPEDLRVVFRDKDAARVLRDIFQAKAKQTPEIAEPIIDKAVDDEKITSAQADDLREKLKNGPRFFPGPGFGPRHGPGGPHGFGHFGNVDRDVAAVVRDIHEAVEKKAPEIAEPIINKAVDKQITNAQANDIRAKLKQVRSHRAGPPGPHPGGQRPAVLGSPA